MRKLPATIAALVLAACSPSDDVPSLVESPSAPVADMAMLPDLSELPDLTMASDLTPLPDLSPAPDMIECGKLGEGPGLNGCCLGNPYRKTAAGTLRCCVYVDQVIEPRQSCASDAECCDTDPRRRTVCNMGTRLCSFAN